MKITFNTTDKETQYLWNAIDSYINAMKDMIKHPEDNYDVVEGINEASTMDMLKNQMKEQGFIPKWEVIDDGDGPTLVINES